MAAQIMIFAGQGISVDYWWIFWLLFFHNLKHEEVDFVFIKSVQTK